jgi:hypothetical protein
MKKHRNDIYRTITGRTYDLSHLEPMERQFLISVSEKYKNSPEWSEFSSWWTREFDAMGLNEEGMAYRICQDLEATLGIAQGKVSPPDYRDFLADLIEIQYGSRYKFCKDTGTDPGHLSRVLSGQSNLSLQTLIQLLHTMRATLTIQTEDILRANVSPRKASRVLANIK